jgi:hypothetical protein
MAGTLHKSAESQILLCEADTALAPAGGREADQCEPVVVARYGLDSASFRPHGGKGSPTHLRDTWSMLRGERNAHRQCPQPFLTRAAVSSRSSNTCGDFQLIGSSLAGATPSDDPATGHVQFDQESQTGTFVLRTPATDPRAGRRAARHVRQQFLGRNAFMGALQASLPPCKRSHHLILQSAVSPAAAPQG